ncbi:hypothetical protein N7471_008144 [Penicillium samsonianum]|uniref:uncharacterized protein n=1 Tax=Penicillium samsonianum TaxID=1882272 RepID=UPI00254852D5|nr:uncharacterized protein N7471_008144 [Penicillium samsonianum]KAJ6132929.1 hypothetical protein N7471_008144 [Penicillium samsonianum]
MDTNGLPYLGNMNKTGSDPQFARMLPMPTAIDWRSTRADAQRSARAGMPLRSVIGQLCGHQAPVGQECDSCAKGNGRFVNCRVLFLPDPKQPSIQWSWACASRNFSSGANKCSFRPENNNPYGANFDSEKSEDPDNVNETPENPDTYIDLHFW